MDKKEILYFEEDDTSGVGINGNQVFVAKRINGKITHNKSIEQSDNTLNNEEKPKETPIKLPPENQEELFVEFKTKKIHKKERLEPKNTKKVKNQNNEKRKQQPRKNIQKKSQKQIKQLKQQKKKQRINKIIFLIVIIIAVIIFAFVSPLFNIETITVEGNDKISEETIISLSGLQKGNNIFKNIKKEIKEKIKENQYIENVQIKRNLPGNIQIVVEEREIEYQVKVLNGYVYLDYQGYILENSSKKTNVPEILGLSMSSEELLSNKRVNDKDIDVLKIVLEIMKEANNKQIDNLITQIIVNEDEYKLYLEKEKKYINLGDGSNLKTKMLYVPTIIEKEKKSKGTIHIERDINEGFKPYFEEEK